MTDALPVCHVQLFAQHRAQAHVQVQYKAIRFGDMSPLMKHL
jgi:hypothetical protein